jgi:hypothetical protein
MVCIIHRSPVLPTSSLNTSSNSEDPKRCFRGQVLGFRGQVEVKSRSHIGRKEVDPRRQRGQTDKKVSFITPFSSIRHTVFRNPSQKPTCFRGESAVRHIIFLSSSHHFPNTVPFLKKGKGTSCKFVLSVVAKGVSPKANGKSKPQALSLAATAKAGSLTIRLSFMGANADGMSYGAADGKAIVPVLYETGSSMVYLSETGSLMAYLLYPDPTAMLGELYGFISSFRQLPDNFQRTSREHQLALLR